mmetsp:Transcript_8499/g.25680  ORF Transcript_8499/g.25680 Transcript_8499/m.25680 type:complete len:289 (-) Transcript_8499:365-1231(-)
MSTRPTSSSGDGNNDDARDLISPKPGRRSFLSTTIAGLAGSSFALALALAPSPPNARADDGAGAGGGKKKIVVFGGSGYVGAHVCQILSSQGAEVISASRSSPSDQAARVRSILGGGASSDPLPGVEYRSIDANDASASADLAEILSGASAAVSLVGAAPGSKNQREGNGAVNARIADAAKGAGITRFVYVSVSSELSDGPARFLLGEYFRGKREAESAVWRDFGPSDALVIKPAIIAGGPPGEIRPPGPPGVAPVPVDAVAKAVAAGALGRFSGSIDGNAAIVAAVN